MEILTKIVIDGFWGNRRIEVDLFPDVTFFIGPNGSGKTTLINLIAAALTVDYRTLEKITFEKISISLARKRSGRSKNLPAIIVSKHLEAGNQKIVYDLSLDGGRVHSSYSLTDVDGRFMARWLAPDAQSVERLKSRGPLGGRPAIGALGLLGELESLVSVNWLSVDRTLNQGRWGDGRSYETAIDFRLEVLSNKLVRFLSKIAQERDDAIREFQQKVLLSFIEFPADSTTRFNVKATTLEAVKEIATILKKTFRDAKIDDSIVESYVSNFIARAESALDKFNKLNSDRERRAEGAQRREPPTSEQMRILNDFFMVSQKISDSSKVADLASKLQERLDEILLKRNLFVQTANNLYSKKKMIINDSNEILFETLSGKILTPQALSSGEKQMLVLLSEMFLQNDQKSIMIADEPELSLHLLWQETLIDSLKNLNPFGQIIVATHSPDIVGGREDRVISVDEIIR
jgi:predicted ATP-dependent endonuclease of OLD family